MAVHGQVPRVLLVIKEKRVWKVNKDIKEMLVLQDQKVIMEIEVHEET